MLALTTVLIVVLALTTVLALGALILLVRRPPSWLAERALEVDPVAAGVLDRTPRPPAAAGTTRRLISIEILNAVELAGTRGRLAGLAGSLVPGLTRRIVYDQTLKIVRAQLADQHVRADVRLHVLRPAGSTDGRATDASDQAPSDPAPARIEVVDVPIELGDQPR